VSQLYREIRLWSYEKVAGRTSGWLLPATRSSTVVPVLVLVVARSISYSCTVLYSSTGIQDSIRPIQALAPKNMRYIQ
jgi:hypothetical protein